MALSFSNKKPRRFWRQFFIVFILLSVLALIFLTAWLVIPVLSDPADGFISNKGIITRVTTEIVNITGNDRFTKLHINSDSGLSVSIATRMSLDVEEPRPLVLLLGGHRTGRDAVLLPKSSHGLALAAISYPHIAMRKPSGLKLLGNMREYQQAFRDTPAAVLLALEYLLSQDFVDKNHVELVGVSLGAFLISAPAAMDLRVKRAWLIHGAGDPERVIYHNLKHRIPNKVSRKVVAKLLALFSSSQYLKAERWVGQLSPRPVIVINAREDESFPVETVQTLHQALAEPSEIIWTEGSHVGSGKKKIINQLTELVLKRIASETNIKSE